MEWRNIRREFRELDVMVRISGVTRVVVQILNTSVLSQMSQTQRENFLFIRSVFWKELDDVDNQTLQYMIHLLKILHCIPILLQWIYTGKKI